MAEGTTVIKDAGELKFKESNRIEATTNWLKHAGVNCEATDDGMIIEGTGRILGGEFHSLGDHRIAMSIGIAGLFSESPITVIESKSVEICDESDQNNRVQGYSFCDFNQNEK